MPKDLQNKSCRANTKNCKSNNVASPKNCAKKNSLLKVTKVLAGKIVKKRNSPTKKLRKILTNNNADKVQVKTCRKKADIPIKTRSGACLVDSNAGKTTGGKMKEKQKPAEKVKPNDKPKVKKEPAIKKSSYIAGNTVTTIKKDAKKVKEDETAKKTVKSTPKVDKADDDKKETKIPAKKTPKLKKDDDKKEPKKDDESVNNKKDTKKDSKTKDDTPKGTDKEKGKTDPAKKRTKKTKEPCNETANKKEDDKSPSSNDTDKKESSQLKKIKFFKSKSKKLDKTKEPSKKNNELKDAFSVYDNIDDSSNDESKVKKKEPLAKTKITKIGKEAEIKIKANLEELKKSKLKRKLDVTDEKHKFDSDSDVEKKCRKKVRKNVEDDDDEDDVKPKTKKSKSLKDDESLSSDNMPLNKLVTKTKAKVKREPLSDCSETDTKKKKTESPKKSKKSPPKKNNKGKKETEKPTKSKKVVRFEKQVTKVPAKATRRRKQRMASLNAMAMVHCLYENEYKSVSVSSYDSTENSEVDNPEPKRKQESQVEVKQENNETALLKYENKPNPRDPDPVTKRESLRTAPGLRSVGKHWDMNSSSISSTLSDDNIEMMPPPIVIKEIAATIDKPKNALKKKFARALRRQVSEESSEEEKHQALLIEEKKRMVRRRRRQRKEITMDLKDMVVCKRMASLNATAILAASYSSTTGKRTITVKSSGKAEEKRENAANYAKTESVMAKIKNRKLSFMRKKFTSSSDADVEDEADLSGSEVVVKTATSSGKQQVSLIVNQDSGVTITGLYLNSTTKSTHHQGYCSISGMQYRISSTSHTQTEAATTVTTEAIVRTPQEPLRPPITVSLHGDRQSPSRVVANHVSPVKTYTPLGALSNMQPPGSPHHVHHPHYHPKTVTISSTQEISSLERHGCPSAFSAPTVYGPPPPPPLPSVPARVPYPMLPKTPPEPGFVTVGKITPAPDPSISPRGINLEDIDDTIPEAEDDEEEGERYYQPAGPLISHHHHHHHHHHHVQTNTTTTTSTAALPASTATSTSSSPSTISFAKVSQSPLIQPPTPPASNVTHPVSENSDNEITSATTPATEIAPSAEAAQEETNFPPAYRFGSSANPPFRSPSHNYQSYYPSPPSTASLSHPQQQAHFQEILYSNPPAGPPGPYHLSYLQPKGAPYHAPFQRRYIPALPPQQYFHHEYPSSAPGSQQVIVPAHPLTSSAESYHSAPPTPSMVESYPPPPPPLYYSGYSSAPPTPYYPYATSSRSLTLVETSCPCPLQGCQKNVHTGPLTGIISKGPVKQHSTPLSPVALSLPKEPQDIRSLPSPARGSAGCRPTPSPAIATAKNPSCWSESTDCSYDTTGLLAISKNTENSILTKGKNGIKNSSRTELKKMKIKKSRKTSKHVCKQDENKTIDYRPNGGRPFYTDVLENDSVGLITASIDYVSRVKPTIMEIESDICDENILIEQNDDQKCKKYRKRRSVDDQLEKDMLKAYPVMRENVQKTIHVPDDEPVVKKPKLDDLLVNNIDEKPMDVEKNNYLSALQLCSVNNAEKLEEEIDNDTLNISENLAPRKREEETNVKIQAKHVETVDQTTQSTTEEQIAQPPSPTPVSAAAVCRNLADSRKPPRLRRKRWTNKKKNKKKSNKATKSSEEEKIEAENAEKIRRAELLSLTQKRASCKLKWSNGWSWLGEPFVSKVFLNTEGSEVLRTCYPAMKHQSGDIIKPKDCILLRSGSKKSDLPYVAKVAHLWEDPEDGEMMMSLFWFYRPEHTEHESIHSESPYELYASKHKDINSVACIEDKCYVLTFNEYCRYHKSIRQSEESVDVSSVIVPPLSKKRYPRHSLLPPENTSLDLVYFCRKIYDFRQHRLLKNPFFV